MGSRCNPNGVLSYNRTCVLALVVLALGVSPEVDPYWDCTHTFKELKKQHNIQRKLANRLSKAQGLGGG